MLDTAICREFDIPPDLLLGKEKRARRHPIELAISNLPGRIRASTSFPEMQKHRRYRTRHRVTYISSYNERHLVVVVVAVAFSCNQKIKYSMRGKVTGGASTFGKLYEVYAILRRDEKYEIESLPGKRASLSLSPHCDRRTYFLRVISK